MSKIGEWKECINRYFVGKEEVVENVLLCLLAGGHVLLEDVPGVGKTMLCKTLAASMGADFGRIQFTPDTLPSDVTGVSAYNLKTGEFEYHMGQVFHQIVLADEINRTSPKTQSSLLEVMAENQVTVDGTGYAVPSLFCVIATQNPLEYLGTYPLPEAQLDRFMMKLSLGYPDAGYEIQMAKNFLEGRRVEEIQPVCTVAEVEEMKEDVNRIQVRDNMLEYMRNIVELTRKESRFQAGASPRAYLSLVQAARAKAYLDDRDYVKPDDVKAVCVNVLHHRISLTAQARIQKEDPEGILRSLMLQAKIPME